MNTRTLVVLDIVVMTFYNDYYFLVTTYASLYLNQYPTNRHSYSYKPYLLFLYETILYILTKLKIDYNNVVFLA